VKSAGLIIAVSIVAGGIFGVVLGVLVRWFVLA
jgi:hypothetical protein